MTGHAFRCGKRWAPTTAGTVPSTTAERSSIPQTLIIYFIRSGGAEDFAARYKMAMSCDNRWYCSEFYGYDVRDPEILWGYFNRSACADHASPRLALAR